MSEKELTQFVTRLQSSAGDNLENVVLFGSAATSEFSPEFSDINLLCVLADLSIQKLASLGPTIRWWMRRKHPAPLLFTGEELERSADVFAIEFLDIKQHHRVLFGEDVFSRVQVRLDLHQRQLRHELRTKLLLLRERFVIADGNRQKTVDLLLHSISSFLTLFRHALIALGEQAPSSKQEILEQSASTLGFDKLVFVQLLEIREGKRDKKSLNPNDAFARYFSAIEHVARSVDALPISPNLEKQL